MRVLADGRITTVDVSEEVFARLLDRPRTSVAPLTAARHSDQHYDCGLGTWPLLSEAELVAQSAAEAT